MTVRGSLDRAKDASPVRGADGAARTGSRTLRAYADDVPFLDAPGDTRCRRRDRPQGRSPSANATDRPRSSFRRSPAKGYAIQETRVPSTAAATGRGGIAPSIPAPASRSRRPHVLPRVGRVSWMGIASLATPGTMPRRRSQESVHLCEPAESRAWG